MVWHAYQLNPRDFLEDCLRYGKMRFWRTGLPWKVINSCIDNDTFEFNPPTEAVQYFERRTKHSFNSLQDPYLVRIQCPMCNEDHSFPWTTWNSKAAWTIEKVGRNEILKGETSGSGFADKNFLCRAPCGFLFDHEQLKTQKFLKDIQLLRFKDVPMPGTLLSLDGGQHGFIPIL